MEQYQAPPEGFAEAAKQEAAKGVGMHSAFQLWLILPTPSTNLGFAAHSPAPCWGWGILLLHFVFSRSSAQQFWVKSAPKLTLYGCTEAVTIPDPKERSFKGLPLCEVTSELGILEFGGSSGAIVHQIRYLNTYSRALRMDISRFDSDMLEGFLGV